MLSNNSEQQDTCTIIYIVKKSAQNTFAVVTSFFYLQNSNTIKKKKKNKPSTTVGKLASGSHFVPIKNTRLTCLENLRDDYNVHIHNTYNKKYEFIKISSNFPNSFRLGIRIKVIEKPEDHINYSKLLNNIPTLTLLEDVCIDYSIVDLDLEKYSDTIIHT